MDAPRAGRRAAALVLARLANGRDRADDLALVVSELVTNAVVHGPDAEFELRLRASARVIRVEVNDQGTKPFEWPVNRDGRLHGLDLVNLFSERCGVRRLPSTLAWCEFDLA
jgi:anti-sigma regulatory factor (Ser/Thr protein kinase)